MSATQTIAKRKGSESKKLIAISASIATVLRGDANEYFAR
jgi:hypothetical protein